MVTVGGSVRSAPTSQRDGSSPPTPNSTDSSSLLPIFSQHKDAANGSKPENLTTCFSAIFHSNTAVRTVGTTVLSQFPRPNPMISTACSQSCNFLLKIAANFIFIVRTVPKIERSYAIG